MSQSMMHTAAAGLSATTPSSYTGTPEVALLAELVLIRPQDEVRHGDRG